LLLAATAMLLAVALVGQFVPPRTSTPRVAPAAVIEVTNGRDGGPGSLRAAILQTAGYQGRASIVLRTDVSRLRTPLPAVVNPNGFDIIGGTPDRAYVIDGSDLAAGPVLALASPGATVRDLVIRGARAVGIEVRASGVVLSNVTLTRCATGIRVGPRVDALTVENSAFVESEIGIDAEISGREWYLRENHFEESGAVAIRLISPQGTLVPAHSAVVIRQNRFERDRIAVLAVGQSTRIEENEVADATDVGIYVSGGRTAIGSNRVRGARRAGIVLHQLERARVFDNEIDHNRVGLVLNSVSGATVERNNIHENTAGLVHVFGESGAPNLILDNQILTSRFDGVTVVGSSPLLRSNRVLGSGGASIRISTFIGRDGVRQVSEPLLEDNVLDSASRLDVVRDLYFETEAGEQR
jgi:parallel beta-helix repeat protein